MNFDKIDNNVPFTDRDSYELTRYYVNYYWNSKFCSLKETMELDDCFQEVYLKFLRHDLFRKYDPSITTKKYYVCRSVYTTMVDLLRKQKRTMSLDTTTDDSGTSFLDYVEDTATDVENEASGSADRLAILSQLPNSTTSKIRGIAPDGAEIDISYRTLALLLEQGFTVKDLSQMYKNPDTGSPLSEGTISRHIKEMREYCLSNVVLV